MKRKQRTLALILIMGIAAALNAGCRQSDKLDPARISQSQAVVSAADELPIAKTPVTFKMWRENGFQKHIPTLANTEGYAELEKRTGVHIELIEPPAGQEAEFFRLMISSGDYPDMIYNANAWNAAAGKEWSYPGGGDAGVKDGVFLKLNDLIAKYAPNYTRLREMDPLTKKLTISDAGNMWAMFSINFYAPDFLPKASYGSTGMALRKDWVESLGLKMPVTIDDWYTVLKAFKEKKNCEAPLLLPKTGVMAYSAFLSAFGTTYSNLPNYEFYQVDGKVKFGPLEPGYKEYLTLMNKWYNEGLIDKNFASRNEQEFWKPLLANDKAGAYEMGFGWTGDQMYAQQKAAKDPKFFLGAVMPPVRKEGDVIRFNYRSLPATYATVVTTACKNPEIAVRWLDYQYSEEGAMLMNYGIEGKSYVMVNGEPQYTHYVMNDKILAPPYMAIKAASIYGPGLNDSKKQVKIASLKQLEALDLWKKNSTEWVLPPLTLVNEESSQYASIMSDVTNYVTEKTVKFIMGIEPLSNYDSFVSQVKKMNIDKAIQIKQAALDRFNKH